MSKRPVAPAPATAHWNADETLIMCHQMSARLIDTLDEGEDADERTAFTYAQASWHYAAKWLAAQQQPHQDTTAANEQLSF